jgi:hypothetical protein
LICIRHLTRSLSTRAAEVQFWQNELVQRAYDGRNNADVWAWLFRPGYDLFGPEAHTANGQHWTVEDLVRAVQKWYGVSWKTRTSYHQLFEQCGHSYQRTEKVYKSRREREVLEFEAQVEKK